MHKRYNYKSISKYLSIFLLLSTISTALSFADRKPLCTSDANGSNATRLIVKITGLTPPKGFLRLGLYKGEKAYEKKDAIDGVKMKIDSSNVTLEFKGLCPGDYAIMFYHDKNGNGRFDRLLGIPLESYGFSNNARPSLGPPSFKKTKFRICPGKTTVQKLKAQ